MKQSNNAIYINGNFLNYKCLNCIESYLKENQIKSPIPIYIEGSNNKILDTDIFRLSFEDKFNTFTSKVQNKSSTSKLEIEIKELINQGYFPIINSK